MLMVGNEIIPDPNTGQRRLIDMLSIVNIGFNGYVGHSDYKAFGSEAVNPVAGTPAWTYVAGVRGHDRAQSV